MTPERIAALEAAAARNDEAADAVLESMLGPVGAAPRAESPSRRVSAAARRLRLDGSATAPGGRRPTAGASLSLSAAPKRSATFDQFTAFHHASM